MVDKKRSTIYAFVEAGKDYFPKLCKALMALVYYTPVFHEDQKHLSNIVDGMYVCTHVAMLPPSTVQPAAVWYIHMHCI